MESLYAIDMERSEIDEEEFTDAELAILDKLAEGRGTPGYLAEELDLAPVYVRDRLKELKRLGLVRKIHRGLYELNEDDE